ncbi:MAG: hypothetical protein IPL32_03115 [Chloracidobacterium sp.]|nr:hypothetical protein [Chloracidobacterium sp.]
MTVLQAMWTPNKIGIAICFAIVMLGIQVTTAQTKERLIPFPEWSLDYTAHEVSLELIEIKIDGKSITLDSSFKADENWLKNITFRVKNIGTKPIVYFSMGGGLLNSVSEELPMYGPLGASFRYGIGWTWGKSFKPSKKQYNGPVLKVGEIVELSYTHVDALTRRVLAKEGEGAFCKLKFMTPGLQYADGSSPFSPPMRFRKNP